MTTPVFDPANEQHQTALGRLRDDQIGWLGSVRPDGRPHVVPVWFFWNDGQIIVFSEPKTQKIRNLRHAQNVALHLNSGLGGEEIVIVDGTAQISDQSTGDWLPTVGEAYGTKYGDGLKHLGLTLEQMATQFSQVIVITPAKVTAW